MANLSIRTEQLLQRIAKSERDKTAVAELMSLYRGKIRRLISVHMDRRMVARVDPSDAVQETLVAAMHRLREYVKTRPIAFYPWLREIAMNRLIDLHRRHVLAQKRSVTREDAAFRLPLPDESQIELVSRFVDTSSSPSRRIEKMEVKKQVKDALEQLAPDDREILVLKYLDELTAPEIAAVLNVTERTVWRRHTRAVEQIGKLLSWDQG
jgi:RNA polymerase sigma-70 factor (ECF subfamily)